MPTVDENLKKKLNKTFYKKIKDQKLKYLYFAEAIQLFGAKFCTYY